MPACTTASEDNNRAHGINSFILIGSKSGDVGAKAWHIQCHIAQLKLSNMGTWWNFVGISM